MKEINNIIFDFGAVIINIDPDAVLRSLMENGISNIGKLNEALTDKQIYRDLETGAVEPAEFRAAIRETLGIPISDESIDAIWNSILLDIPPERVAFLNRLKTKYNIYLLSNTNAIHYDHYNRYFIDTYDYPSLDSFFKRAWYSHLLGVRKPDPAIFQLVLNDGRLDPAKTAFIDDMKVNVDAAATLGIHPVHLPEGKEIMDLFDEKLVLKG